MTDLQMHLSAVVSLQLEHSRQKNGGAEIEEMVAPKWMI
jgi:hypothetical protein